MTSTFLNIYMYIYNRTVYYWHNVVQQTSRTYSSCITEILYSLNSDSPFHPTRQLLATTILLSAPMSLTILNTSYKWDHAVFVLLRLAYFLWCNLKYFWFQILRVTALRGYLLNYQVVPLASGPPSPVFCSKRSFFFFLSKVLELNCYSKFQIICSNHSLWIVISNSIGTFQLRSREPWLQKKMYTNSMQV